MKIKPYDQVRAMLERAIEERDRLRTREQGYLDTLNDQQAAYDRLRERCAALEKEHTKALKDWAASEKRNLTLREENERLRKTVDYLRVPEL